MAQSDQSFRSFNQDEAGSANQDEARSAGAMGREPLVLSGLLDRTQRYQTLRLPDGSVVQVETEAFMRTAPATGGTAADFENAATPKTDAGREGVLIPVVEESLEVGKRTITTGTVRLHKTVQEYEQALDEPLAVRTYDVERVVRNQPVESAPPVRHEGETTIYPLIEERLVLTKQLILREEIRVTKRDTERRDTQVVTLRREHIEVERMAGDGKPGDAKR